MVDGEEDDDDGNKNGVVVVAGVAKALVRSEAG